MVRKTHTIFQFSVLKKCQSNSKNSFDILIKAFINTVLLCLGSDAFMQSIFIIVEGRTQGHTKVTWLPSKIWQNSPHVCPDSRFKSLVHGHDVGTKAWLHITTGWLKSIVKQGSESHIFVLLHWTRETVAWRNSPIRNDTAVYHTDVLWKIKDLICINL